MRTSTRTEVIVLRQRFLVRVAALFFILHFSLLCHMHTILSSSNRLLLLSWEENKSSPTESEDLYSSLPRCRYNGHCPLGTTCAAVLSSLPPPLQYSITVNSTDSSTWPGVCEPIRSSSSSILTSSSRACFDECFRELIYDEYYFHETFPRSIRNTTVISQGRPLGCRIEFESLPNAEEPPSKKNPSTTMTETRKNTTKTLGDDWSDTMHEWVDSIRGRYIQRTELLTTNHHNHVYCFAPCSSSADCRTSNEEEDPLSVPAFTCENQVCRRNPNYWNDPPVQEELTIVTGANAAYFRGLKNLVGSLYVLAPGYSVVVYNLGLSEDQVLQVQKWPNTSLEWPSGIPSNLPKHFSKPKLYAWKPHIIEETVRRYGSILWLDAGNTVTGPLDPLVHILRQEGAFLVKGQDSSMKIRSHPGTYEYFGYEKTAETSQRPHFSGNTQGFLYPSRYYDEVVVPNRACGWDMECIAPPGSSLMNHRYDQTSLSVLLYFRLGNAVVPHFTEYLAASSAQLHPNKHKASVRRVWTSRQQLVSYGIWMDRLLNKNNNNPKK